MEVEKKLFEEYKQALCVCVEESVCGARVYLPKCRLICSMPMDPTIMPDTTACPKHWGV